MSCPRPTRRGKSSAAFTEKMPSGCYVNSTPPWGDRRSLESDCTVVRNHIADWQSLTTAGILIEHNMGTTLSDLAEDYPGQSFAPCPICPVCPASSRILHSASNIHPDEPYAFNFRVCSTCSHGWIDPMPTPGLLNYLYGRGSRSVIGEWGPNQLTIPEQVCVRREMKRTPGRYFELGVGDGHLYRLFVERGWKCTGVDPGDWAGRFPNVYRDLSDVDPTLTADLLVAFDVLEHVSDPVSMLRNLWKLAAPKAKLYCAMPNRESLRG